MTWILAAWAVSAAALVGLAIGLGQIVKSARGPLGILVDTRGRISLNRLQLVTWTLVILSLIAGVFFGRLVDGVANPLNITIPDDVLGLLGITLASGVTSGAVKAAKNTTASARLATQALTANKPSFDQVFLLEEGQYADQVVDVTKFQNFVFTLVLVVAYVAMAIDAIVNAKTAGGLTALPGLSGTFLVLLGISNAAYVTGKLPPQAGAAPTNGAAAGAVVA